MKGRKVGVIGLGNMGGGNARCLQQAGVSVAVWDIDETTRNSLVEIDGIIAAAPGEMARDCEAIFFVVPGSEEIRTCLNGSKGILANARKRLVVCDLTTSDPVVTKKLAKRAASKGVDYLDAGMSGGATGADAGTLTLMMGGRKQAFKRLSKYFEIIAKNIFYLGDSGSGHTMKLVHNMVCHSIFLATSEGARLAEKSGIKLADAVAVMNAGNARSFISERRFPDHIISNTWDARSFVYNLHKDLEMAVALSQKSGQEPKIGQQTLAFLSAAVALDMSDLDFSNLYKHFDKITNRQK